MACSVKQQGRDYLIDNGSAYLDKGMLKVKSIKLFDKHNQELLTAARDIYNLDRTDLPFNRVKIGTDSRSNEYVIQYNEEWFTEFQVVRDSYDIENNRHYQLEADRTKKVDKRVERIVRRFFNKVGVKLEAIEEYEKRMGQKIDAVALADLTKGIVAFAKGEIDGTTLTEEAFHFIVQDMWGDATMERIRNDESLTQNPIWTNNWHFYMKEYNNDVVKVQKEIIGKLLAEYVYAKAKEHSVIGRIGKFFRRLLGKFFSKFNRDDVTVKGVSQELDAILSEIAADFLEGRIKVDLANIKETSERVSTRGSKSHFLHNLAQDTISKLQERMKDMEKKQVGLIYSISKTKFKGIVAKYGKSAENLQKAIDTLNSKSRLNDIDRKEVELISELLLQEDLDNTVLNRIRRNMRSIKRINNSLKKSKYDMAIVRMVLGIPDVDAQGNPVWKDGIRDDLQAAVKVAEEILDPNNDRKINYRTYSTIKSQVDLYSQSIKSLTSYINQGKTFETLEDELQKELKQGVEDAKVMLNKLDEFLETQTKVLVKEIYDKFLQDPQFAGMKDSIEGMMKSSDEITLHESNIAELWLYGQQTGKEPLFKKLVMLVEKANQEVRANSIDKAKTLMDKLDPDLNELRNVFGSLTKVFKKFSERDSKGNKTGYWLDRYKIADWVKNREESFEQARRDAQEYAKGEFRKVTITLGAKSWTSVITLDDFKVLQAKYDLGDSLWNNSSVVSTGANLFIPDNSDMRARLWNEHMDLTDNRSLWMQAVNKFYNRKKAMWFHSNTRVLPTQELNRIINNRKATLNNTQYALWRNRNIVEVRNELGDILYRYYKGELIVPSDGGVRKSTLFRGGEIRTTDWKNPKYDKITDTEKRVLETLKSEAKKTKRGFTSTYDYAYMRRLPQITRSVGDFFASKDKGASFFTDKFNDFFKERDDEALFANRANGTLIRRPPIRYTGLLENPNTITDDVLGSTIMYMTMGENFKGFNKIIPEVHSIRDFIEKSDVQVKGLSRITPKLGVRDKGTTPGSESILLKRADQVLETMVYGETKKGDEKVEGFSTKKTILSFTEMLRGVNLLFNPASMITGAIKSRIDLAIEHIAGRFTDKEDWKAAHSIYHMNLSGMIKDFETTKKTNKISLMMEYVGILDSIEDIYRGNDKTRAFRIIGRLLDWGGWRAVDVGMKSRSAIAIARSIRILPEGDYLTTVKYKERLKRLSTEERVELKEKFDNAPRLYDLINTNTSGSHTKLQFDSRVSKQAINYWVKSTKVLSTRADQQLTNFDKSGLDQNAYLAPLTLHTNWLRQTIERSFKGTDFNWATEQEEVGYLAGAYEGLKAVVSAMRFHDKGYIEELSPAQKEASMRVLLMSAVLAISYLAAYLAWAAMYDEGDDEENTLRWYATYVLTRLLLENQAGLSIDTMREYLDNPVAGISVLNNLIAPIRLFLEVTGITESEKVGAGMYEGHSKAFRALIKMLPGGKGLYENYLGGYINGMLGKGSETVSTSYKGKSQYLRDRVVNSGGALNFPIAEPIKWTTKQAARAVTGVESIGSDLPTKKANK